jgi:hypothetical protein
MAVLAGALILEEDIIIVKRLSSDFAGIFNSFYRLLYLTVITIFIFARFFRYFSNLTLTLII